MSLEINVNPFEDPADRRTRMRIAAEERQTAKIVRVEKQKVTELQALRSEMTQGLAQISEGLAELSDVLQWGFSELTKRLDRQSELLEKAVLALESPQTTLANEARRRGIERFQNGWLDEAKEEFERCLSANSTDYLGHLFIALTNFMQGNRAAALDHGQRAASDIRDNEARIAKNNA